MLPNDKELRRLYGRDVILHTDNPMSFERFKQIYEIRDRFPDLSIAEQLAQLYEIKP